MDPPPTLDNQEPNSDNNKNPEMARDMMKGIFLESLANIYNAKAKKLNSNHTNPTPTTQTAFEHFFGPKSVAGEMRDILWSRSIPFSGGMNANESENGPNQTITNYPESKSSGDVTFYTSDFIPVYGNKNKLSKISPLLKVILDISENGEIDVEFNSKIMKAFVRFSNGFSDSIFGNEIELYKVAKEFSVDDLMVIF